MKIKGKIPLAIVAVLAWVVIVSSCANQGMPTGGPLDSLPPMLIGTHPEYRALNYKGKEVRFNFNEYINTEDISEELVISPPLSKRPIIRTKGRSLIIEFNEDLKDSATYSLDFKNSVADNNEKNPYKNLRFSFSTGDVYDSLRVAGKVLKSFNLEPVVKNLVFLHKNLHDSAAFKLKPDYIAKTDEKGLFMIDNIAPGKYNLFAINDLNNDLKYNEGAEEIAFADSLVVPSAIFVEELDTLVSGVDSFLVLGHTQFLPEPFYLRLFTEDIFEQYIKSSTREKRNKFIIVFNESVADSFQLKPVGLEAKDWYQMEYNENVDSLVFWIRDTLVARVDTLFMEVSYFQLDSASQLYVQKDTLDFVFVDKTEDSSKRKTRKVKGDEDEEEKPEPVEQFNWESSPGSAVIELNQKISLLAPDPVNVFDSTKIFLHLTADTLKKPLPFAFEKDTAAWRTYHIGYKWEPEVSYTLVIDSAACFNIFGISSKKLVKTYTAREEDYYGSKTLQLSGVTMPVILQLLKNEENEEVLLERKATKDGDVLFDFLSPGKYKIKVIYDENGNGKWDRGSFQDKIQPEKVAYINEVVKVRSNWDETYIWDLKPDPTFVKNIRDIELEEKQRKEAEEKARQEKENQNRQQNQNIMQGTGGFNRN